MTLALALVFLGVILIVAAVKGYSVRGLFSGTVTPGGFGSVVSPA